jgi:myo-inositol-1(or 4)-monophosphatase
MGLKMSVDTSSLLKIAVEAALQAGTFLSTSQSVNRRVNQEFDHDVKIEADLQSEKILLTYLKKESSFGILSEESLQNGAEGELNWIIDPIDGTLNFQRGIPICCVSVGLWRGNEPLLGAIYDFNRKEMFSGIVGQGAWLNGAPIKVSTTPEKSKAILLTGYPAAMSYTAEGLKPWIEQAQAFRKLRWIGSAALSLAYVACGRGDVYYEQDIMLWDIAAGVPIVLGAGGKYIMEPAGKPLSHRVFASNAHINK